MAVTQGIADAAAKLAAMKSKPGFAESRAAIQAKAQANAPKATPKTKVIPKAMPKVTPKATDGLAPMSYAKPMTELPASMRMSPLPASMQKSPIPAAKPQTKQPGVIQNLKTGTKNFAIPGSRELKKAREWMRKGI